MKPASERLRRIEYARLYVLIDGGRDPDSFRQVALELVEAGVDVLQLRDKRLSDRQLLERARLLHELTRDSPTLLIVNDRPDLALLAEADGVHVGQEELPVEAVRQLVGKERLVGVSTHSLAQARQAVQDGADYIGCGPTFPSGTKSFQEFTGLEFLREVVQEIRLPAFAIGGIDRNNLQQVIATGIGRVAVSGAIWRAAAPVAEAQWFLQQLDSAAAREPNGPSTST